MSDNFIKIYGYATFLCANWFADLNEWMPQACPIHSAFKYIVLICLNITAKHRQSCAKTLNV